MKYFIQGKGEVTLTDANYIAEGGEGKIYGKGSTIYKIYETTQKMIPIAKIQELKLLDKPNILIPMDIILNDKNTPIGFTMQWVQKTVPLCKLFSNDFRNKFNFTPQMTLELVEAIQRDMKFIHDQNCLIVDANEMNFLVDNKLQIPYFIDVNGYQTPHFPATALMPSIKDWHSKIFSDLTDWFAFAVVACQLFVGIHPYRGNHPKYQRKDLEKRMQDNVSIFNKDVTVPSAARDFSYIPKAYQNWFFRLFEKGDRLPPPLIAGMLSITPVNIILIQNTDNFIIQLLREYENAIIDYWTVNGNSVAILPNKIYLNKVGYDYTTPDVGVIFSPKTLVPIKVSISDDDFLVMQNVKTDEAIQSNIKASEKMIVGNALFVRYDNHFFEVGVDEFGDRIVTFIRSTWNILPHSTKMFDGLVYQDVLGVPYLLIPYKHNVSSCSIQPIKELKGYKVIDAKQSHGVCVLIGFKNNKYDRIVLKFNKDYSQYAARIIEDVGAGSVNFVTLDNGIVVAITEDDSVEIFSNNIESNSVKIIKDPDINSKMKLYKDGVTVLFADNKKLYKIALK